MGVAGAEAAEHAAQLLDSHLLALASSREQMTVEREGLQLYTLWRSDFGQQRCRVTVIALRLPTSAPVRPNHQGLGGCRMLDPGLDHPRVGSHHLRAMRLHQSRSPKSAARLLEAADDPVSACKLGSNHKRNDRQVVKLALPMLALLEDHPARFSLQKDSGYWTAMPQPHGAPLMVLESGQWKLRAMHFATVGAAAALLLKWPASWLRLKLAESQSQHLAVPAAEEQRSNLQLHRAHFLTATVAWSCYLHSQSAAVWELQLRPCCF
mmetsp:Transcript_48260/g.114779  ORF Transcript_48260/g.114779 Transcript_48260/m.114779 type:complete len:266 (+) Transcript_48260:165-962(+)